MFCFILRLFFQDIFNWDRDRRGVNPFHTQVPQVSMEKVDLQSYISDVSSLPGKSSFDDVAILKLNNSVTRPLLHLVWRFLIYIKSNLIHYGVSKTKKEKITKNLDVLFFIYIQIIQKKTILLWASDACKIFSSCPKIIHMKLHSKQKMTCRIFQFVAVKW